jgi:DHA1 family bicyclomycin/chloramphenicol resistance-like MFS transporter
MFIVALAAVTVIGPLALHFYLPAIPAVRAHFGIGSAAAQLAFSVTLITMAVATLVYGPMSDRWGRRPVLLGGFVLFIVGSGVCVIAPDIETLIGARLVQGIGAACSLVIARAIARDLYDLDRLVKVMAYLTMAYVLGPMLATPLGGLLVDSFGWRSIFVFAVAAGVVILVLLVCVLRETGSRSRDGAAKFNPLRGYGRLARIPVFWGYVLQPGFSSGAFFAHAAAASILMTGVLQRPASEFGLYFLMFPAGFMLGNFISSRLSGRIAIDVMVFVGGAVILIANTALAANIAVFGITPLGLFLPGLLQTMGQGLSLPNAQTGALSIDRHLAGTAAGVAVFFQLFLGAVFAMLVGALADGPTGSITGVILCGGALSFACGIIPIGIHARGRHREPG